jgi:putative peptidoglycan lipid II flippase
MVVPWVERVASWYRTSSHRHVLSAAAVVGVFAFAAKLGGAAKEVVVAHQFGTSDQVDAFGLAITLPSFAISLVGGALNSAFLPAYVDARQREGHAAAQRLLSTVAVLAGVLLVAVSALLAALVPSILGLVSGRFTPEKLRLTAELAYILIPTIVVAGAATLWTAVLNAHHRFARASGAALAVPVLSIAALLVFGRQWGIKALAFGVLAGYCLEALLIARAVAAEGMSVVPRWGGLSEAVRRVVGQYAPMVAGATVMGLNPVIDSLMGARLDAGSVASLGYGNKLVAFAMGIGSISLSSAVFPHFSRLVSSRDWTRLGRTLKLYALAVLAITIPATLLAIVLSEPLARLLYQRGAFGPSDTARVGFIQALYFLQVPFHLTGILLVRFVSATAGNRILMWFSFVNCVVNVVGNVVLTRYLGAAGIALSTSVVYMVSFTLLSWAAWRRLSALRAESGARAEPSPAL